jgi:hypothetical protein
MDTPLPPIQFPVSYGDQDENGVDLSLIRNMLALSPWDRLVLMDRHARDTLILLEYGRQHRESKARSGR